MGALPGQDECSWATKNKMDLSERNPVKEILETPDNLDIEGAQEVKLTDASEFINALPQTDGPKPEVYEYRITKLPEHEILPMSKVKDLVISLCQDMEACKHDPEVQQMKLDDFRLWLMEKNPMYKEFFKKLPRLFRMIVSSKNTPNNLGHIMDLIEMRRHQEGSGQTKKEKEAQVGAYFRSNFSREAKPGEEEEAIRNGSGYAGTPMTRDQVKADLASQK